MAYNVLKLNFTSTPRFNFCKLPFYERNNAKSWPICRRSAAVKSLLPTQTRCSLANSQTRRIGRSVIALITATRAYNIIQNEVSRRTGAIFEPHTRWPSPELRYALRRQVGSESGGETSLPRCCCHYGQHIYGMLRQNKNKALAKNGRERIPRIATCASAMHKLWERHRGAFANWRPPGAISQPMPVNQMRRGVTFSTVTVTRVWSAV